MTQKQQTDERTRGEETHGTVSLQVGTALEHGPQSEWSTPSLDLDNTFHVLKNSRRRAVLQYLHRRGEQLTIGEVAEHIAGQENDCPPEQLSASQRKRVYVGLYQCHLPMMDDLDVIDFEKDRGTLRAAENAPGLLAYIEESTDPAQRWPLYYGAVALVGAIVLSVLVLVELFSPVTGGILVLALSGATLAVAGVHYRSTHPTDSGNLFSPQSGGERDATHHSG